MIIGDDCFWRMVLWKDLVNIRDEIVGGRMNIYVVYIVVYILVGGIFERRRGKEREGEREILNVLWFSGESYFLCVVYICVL